MRRKKGNSIPGNRLFGEGKDLLIPSDIIKIEELITTKSWWDTVDAINRLIGYLAKKYPQLMRIILLNG